MTVHIAKSYVLGDDNVAGAVGGGLDKNNVANQACSNSPNRASAMMTTTMTVMMGQ